jgi:hypothetical protein
MLLCSGFGSGSDADISARDASGELKSTIPHFCTKATV